MSFRFNCLAVIFALVLCGPFAGAATGPATTAPAAQSSTVLHVQRTVIYPYEPLHVVVSYRNRSDQVEKFRVPLRAGINIKPPGGKWQGYHEVKAVFVDGIGAEHVLKPGEQVLWQEVVAVDQQWNHVFAKPGVYWLKASYVTKSAPIRIVVKPLPAGERNLAKFVAANHLYVYFSSTAIRVLRIWKQSSHELHETPTIKISPRGLARLIGTFSFSRYADWAAFGQVLIAYDQLKVGSRSIRGDWGKRTSGKWPRDIPSALLTKTAADIQAQLKQATTLQHRMEKLAPMLIAPVRAECWLRAATLATALDDKTAAQKDFAKALVAENNEAMRDRIILLKNGRRLLAIRRLRHVLKSVQTFQKMRQAHGHSASNADLKRIEAFLTKVAAAVETRDIRKIRACFVEGKVGDVLAKRWSDDLKEHDVPKGPLRISFTATTARKKGNGHYIIHSHINVAAGDKVVTANHPIQLELIHDGEQWHIAGKGAGQ